ncbi:MAG: hypothetical protein ACJAYR_002150 [Sneathiella sp.]
MLQVPIGLFPIGYKKTAQRAVNGGEMIIRSGVF